MNAVPVLDVGTLAAMRHTAPVQLVDVRGEDGWRCATIPGAMRLEARRLSARARVRRLMARVGGPRRPAGRPRLIGHRRNGRR